MYRVVCIQDQGNDLVVAECRALTGGIPNEDGVAPCDDSPDVRHAAYLRYGVRMIAEADSLDDLAERIRKTTFDAPDFRIEYHCIKAHKALTAIPKRDAIIQVANSFGEFTPNLDAPRHRFLLTAHRSRWWFAEIVSESDGSYQTHDAKPYRTSSSLPSRIAGGLVNLVPDARTILDPCCGTGSILLEAARIGKRAVGSDWNVKMAGMTHKNAEYFGYDIPTTHSDARELTTHADAIVTDLPYGKNLEAPVEVLRGILARVATLAPVGVFVAGEDISTWLIEAGYRRVELVNVPKFTGFIRRVHLATMA